MEEDMRKGMIFLVMFLTAQFLFAVGTPTVNSCYIPGSSWGLLACQWFSCGWSAVSGADNYEWEAYTNGWTGLPCDQWYPGSTSSCLTNTDTVPSSETDFIDPVMTMTGNTTHKGGRVRAIDYVPSQIWNPVLRQWVTIYLPSYGSWSSTKWAAFPTVCLP